MKSFFIALDERAKQKLQKAEIAICDFQLDDKEGVVVEENILPAVLEALKAEISSKTKTSFEGIVEIGISAITVSEDKFSVSIEKWNGENSNSFKKLAQEILVPVIKRNVVISVPHGETKKPIADGRFRVWIWSSPSGSHNQSTPKEMWGVRVDCADNSFAPSGEGVAITDLNGWPAAELIEETNLYIHHDICHHGTDRELEIFRHILEETVIELTVSPEEKAERQKKLAEKKRERARQAYAQECSARLQKSLAELENKISNGNAKMRELQQSIVNTIRSVKESQLQLEHLASYRGKTHELYGQEFDKLLTVKGVRDVNISSGIITVFTDILHCVDPRTDRRHEIGAFRIEIYTDGSNDGVHWYNLTRLVEGYKAEMQAPHVFPDGKACLGSAQEVFPELIANYEFAAVAMLAIQFIESVNTDDSAGEHINKWPIAKRR